MWGVLPHVLQAFFLDLQRPHSIRPGCVQFIDRRSTLLVSTKKRAIDTYMGRSPFSLRCRKAVPGFDCVFEQSSSHEKALSEASAGKDELTLNWIFFLCFALLGNVWAQARRKDVAMRIKFLHCWAGRMPFTKTTYPWWYHRGRCIQQFPRLQPTQGLSPQRVFLFCTFVLRVQSGFIRREWHRVV